MGILGKQTLIVKCPHCQATTKVNAHPDKAAINCPRCKTSVPLTYARKYTGKRPVEVTPEAPPIQQGVAAGSYGSESGIEKAAPLPPAPKRKSRPSRDRSGETQFSYPDHTRGFTRYTFLILCSVGLLAIVLAGYLYWDRLQGAKVQEYLSNLRETVEQTQLATKHVRKLLDPLERAESERIFREAVGRVQFLTAIRKRLAEPDESSVPELKKLREELATAQAELATAEEDIKKTQNQVGQISVKEVAPPVSPNLGFSTLVGPPLSTQEPAKPELPKADDQTVIINIPDITKAQWSDEFVKRFALIADDGNGKVTVTWSGDLLNLEVKPVSDPARYAAKINFAKLLYYSRTDRTISIKFSPERVNNYNAEGDVLTPLLIDMKQREQPSKIFPALNSLANIKLDLSRQAEVAAVIEILAADTKLDNTIREQAIKLIPTWSGKESADLLIKLLDDNAAIIRLAAIDALVDSKASSAASVLVTKWDKLDTDRISRALIRFGPEAEAVVLPYLNNNNSIAIRAEVCRVLKEIGTNTAMKPLLDVINTKDQSPVVANAAREAMKAILDRSIK
ncbi:MAG TPA: hypothetical protein PKD72_05205 [Gemmatales bacterium]|nr:hypothetical protein [Gemmatales bacterium]